MRKRSLITGLLLLAATDALAQSETRSETDKSASEREAVPTASATLTPARTDPTSSSTTSKVPAVPAARINSVASPAPQPTPRPTASTSTQAPQPTVSPRPTVAPATPAPQTSDTADPAKPDVQAVEEPARPTDQNREPDQPAYPAENTQRTGSLMNAGPPRAPEMNPDNSDALPPLRQLLLQAPNMQVAEQQRRRLTQAGARILSRRNLSALGFVLSVYRVPDEIDMQSLENDITAEWPVEVNQRYRLLANEQRVYAQRLLGASIPSRCKQPLRLAIMDSAVDPQLAVFGGRIESQNATGKPQEPHEHGNGVAALMVGQEPIAGLLPNAQLLAVNVFADDGAGGMETRTDWLLQGLDAVATYKPTALNMSFGGDYSALLEQVLSKLSETILLVAAAGNGGDAQPMYPAAYAAVNAVGATDGQSRLLPLSNGRESVFWRAPGQDLWTIDHRGRGRYQTGTSFAAPLVAAALAIAAHEGLSLADMPTLWPSGTPDLSDLCVY